MFKAIKETIKSLIIFWTIKKLLNFAWRSFTSK